MDKCEMKSPPVLYRIPGVVSQAADAIYQHYGQGLEGIEQATIPELKELKGVGDQSARCIHAFFHEPSYELWYNDNLRPVYNRKSEYEVLGTVLGRRVRTILSLKRLPVGTIKDLSLSELEKIHVEYIKRRKVKKEKISPKEARKIHDYFHLTGFEFHTRPRGAGRQKVKDSLPEFRPKFPEEILRKVVSVISGKEVDDWRNSLEEKYGDFVHFERFVLYLNQKARPDETTSALPRIFSDLRHYAYRTFDRENEIENKFYKDLSEKEILDDSRYKSMLEELRLKWPI
ncbi:MAG: hypothetical protein NTY20_05280 [Candidatus Aenigmarchaeota archaeon]|nr:hypothetical protein [Candidatus Aenigmarchaeota archaeon]